MFVKSKLINMRIYFKNAIFAVAMLLCALPAYCQWGENPKAGNISALNKLSIVFAAQNTKSPLSMFGHVYLVFHDQITPEPNSITFEFTGSIDGIADYLGTLTGAASGFYKLDYFDNKRREYDLENRSSWRYEVNLTPKELDLFKRNVAELEGSKNKYTVFKNNCASYLIEQISKIKGISYQSESIFFDSPDATIRWLHQNKLIKQSVFIPSSQLKALKYYEQLNPEEKKHLKQIISGFSIGGENNSKEFASAVSSSVDYLIVRDESFESRVNLFSLKKEFPKTFFEIDNNFIEPVNVSGNSTYSALMSNDGVLLKFRPGFLGYENEHLYGLKNVSSEFLSVGVLIDSNSVQIENFTLFKVESYIPDEFLYDSGSQFFDITYKNYRSFYDKRHSESAITFGKGVTSSNGKHLISFLPFVSLRKISADEIEKSSLSAGGRLRMYGNFYDKLSYKSTYDYYATNDVGVRGVWDTEIFTTHFSSLGVSLSHTLLNNHSRFGVRLYKSF
jgi:Domain of unknown function (DUF4105)